MTTVTFTVEFSSKPGFISHNACNRNIDAAILIFAVPYKRQATI